MNSCKSDSVNEEDDSASAASDSKRSTCEAATHVPLQVEMRSVSGDEPSQTTSDILIASPEAAECRGSPDNETHEPKARKSRIPPPTYLFNVDRYLR